MAASSTEGPFNVAEARRQLSSLRMLGADMANSLKTGRLSSGKKIPKRELVDLREHFNDLKTRMASITKRIKHEEAKLEREQVGKQLEEAKEKQNQLGRLGAGLENINRLLAGDAPNTDVAEPSEAASSVPGDATAPAPAPAPEQVASSGIFAEPIEFDANDTTDAFSDTGPENDPSYSRNVPSPVRAPAASAPTPAPAVPPITNSTHALERAVDPFQVTPPAGHQDYIGYYSTRAAAHDGQQSYMQGFRNALIHNHAPAKGHKKFFPDPDPFEVEASKKVIEPPTAVFDYALDDTILHARQQDDPGWQGMALKLGEKRYQETESTIRDTYAERFRAWLRGNCSGVNPANGLSSQKEVDDLAQQDLARQIRVGKLDPSRARFERLPGVSDYLDSFVDAQAKFEQKLIMLQLHGPKDLDDAYLYYKFIVHGTKATPADITTYARKASYGAQAAAAHLP